MLSTKGQLDCYFQYSTLFHKTISCTQYVRCFFRYVLLFMGNIFTRFSSAVADYIPCKCN